MAKGQKRSNKEIKKPKADAKSSCRGAEGTDRADEASEEALKVRRPYWIDAENINQD